MADFNMTRLSSLIIDPTLNTDPTTQGCWIPSIPTANLASISANLIAGIPTVAAPILYNPTTVTYQIYNTRSAAWESLVTFGGAATGVGLISGSPLMLPTGASAAVELPANQINGFIYMDSGNANRIRVYNNNAWHTIAAV